MFESEKTIVFWIGLIVLTLASLSLFSTLWIIAVWSEHENQFNMLKNQVPTIVSEIVFMFIGLYMMKSGVQKEEDISKSEHEIEEQRKDMIR